MPPEQPEPGSKLALDDAIFRWHPISEAARLSLMTSGEHLRLARDAIEADQAYPSAHFTVLRGSLVGAAQAVWVLAPDKPTTRQQRGLTLVAEMCKQLDKYYGEVDQFRLTLDERRKLEEQQRWLQERKGEVEGLRDSRADLNQTEFIRWSLEYLFHDEARRETGRSLWRQMSADAHVLGWAMFQRAIMHPSAHSSALSVGEVGGNWKDIANPFVASHLLLKEGWSLFDRLCEGAS